MNQILALARLFTLVALMVGCSSSKSSLYRSIDSTGGLEIDFEQARLEVEAPVHYRSVHIEEVPGESSTTNTLQGHPFGMRDGVFFIGEHEYGLVRSGAIIRVTLAGVTVDGEKRGPLPEAIETDDAAR